VSSRYRSVALAAIAVLAAGCEQIKSLSKVHELEGKVDALSTKMAQLSGSGAGSGSGSGSAAKPESKSDGKSESKPAHAEATPEHADARPDETKPEDKAGKPAHAEATPDDKDATPDDKVAKPDDKPTKPDDKPTKPDKPAADKPAADKPAADKPSKPAGDPALARLLAVVAENTQGKLGAAGPPVGHWGYDGKTGPTEWGTLDPAWSACGDGKAQSPVDIEPRAGSAAPIELSYKPTAATVIDTGHSLQVNLAPGSEAEIGDTVYQLVQIHFHTPSEHTIAGEHYPLEVQLVHQDANGKLAVISVLYDTGGESKPLGQLWSAWPHKVGVANKLAKPFDVSALLPETRTVFRYTGSLTVPPCTEGVMWNVMRRTSSDSKSHLAAFAARYPHNARDPQTLGDRKIE
jgi:carbonic anhydrase